MGVCVYVYLQIAFLNISHRASEQSWQKVWRKKSSTDREENRNYFGTCQLDKQWVLARAQLISALLRLPPKIWLMTIHITLTMRSGCKNKRKGQKYWENLILIFVPDLFTRYVWSPVSYIFFLMYLCSLSFSHTPSLSPLSIYSFIKDAEWSPCSLTCGEGIRTKEYRCKIFLQLSQSVATLHNESHCFGPKPAPQVERCVKEPCLLAYGYEESYPR